MRKSAPRSRVIDGMNFHNTLKVAALALFSAFASACGVDKIQHIETNEFPFDSGHQMSMDSGHVIEGSGSDSGTVADSGSVEDSGMTVVDAGSEPVDSGTMPMPDSGTPDAGCTRSGISPELAAISGGPYQNCQGGQIPRTDYQENTQPWSGCCGTLVRICQVTGYSMANPIYCQ